MSDALAVRLLRQSEKLTAIGRVQSAKSALEGAQKEAASPQLRGFVDFNLGALCYGTIGDGVRAREHFIALASHYDSVGYGDKPAASRQVHADALENDMLLSLSFEEFEGFAERLRKVDPGARILGGLRPRIMESRERGAPWTEQLFLFAAMGYNRNDPAKDRGHYGQALSTYNLILSNRLKLRLPREDWANAVYEYGTLAQRIVAIFLKNNAELHPEAIAEFKPIVARSLPFIDEYLATNADEGVSKLRSAALSMMEAMDRVPGSSEAGLSGGGHELTRCEKCGVELKTPMAICPSCGHTQGFVRRLQGATSAAGLLGAGAGFWFGHTINFWVGLAAGVCAGLLSYILTLVILAPVLLSRYRARKLRNYN